MVKNIKLSISDETNKLLENKLAILGMNKRGAKQQFIEKVLIESLTDKKQDATLNLVIKALNELTTTINQNTQTTQLQIQAMEEEL